MTLHEVTYGLIGMLIFIPIMIFSLRILEHFLQSGDLSMQEVFVHNRGVIAFKVLAITFAVYAVTLIVAGFGGPNATTYTVELSILGSTGGEIGIIASLDQLGGIIAFLGLAFFLSRVAALTEL